MQFMLPDIPTTKHSYHTFIQLKSFQRVLLNNILHYIKYSTLFCSISIFSIIASTVENITNRNKNITNSPQLYLTGQRILHTRALTFFLTACFISQLIVKTLCLQYVLIIGFSFSIRTKLKHMLWIQKYLNNFLLKTDFLIPCHKRRLKSIYVCIINVQFRNTTLAKLGIKQL